MRKQKRVVAIKVIPGEPTDGSGRICIHLFVQHRDGAFTEPHCIHPVFENGVQVKQQVTCGPARGRLACNHKYDPAPVVRNGVITVTHRTDDPNAVTCPKCRASKDYADLMSKIESINTTH